MRNYLRSNYAEAFTISNPYAANSEGGIALWELPAKFQNAYNPIIFRRSHWYFRTDDYEPTQPQKPNIISSSDAKLVLMYPSASEVLVTYRFNGGVGVGSIALPAGTKEQALSVVPTAIVGISVGGSAIGTTAKDSSYIYLTPDAVYTDDNFLVQGGRILYLAVSDIDTSYLDVYRSDGSLGIKLGAESFAGITTFDVAAVVRTWFADTLANEDSGVVEDGRLSVKYTVKGIGGIGTTYDMVAINGVAQIGENSDRTAAVGKVLTCYDRLVLYDGYPLDFSVLSDEPISTPLGDTASSSISRVRVNGSEVVLDSETSGVAVLDESGLPILVLPSFDIPVFARCVPEQPFYVRWINQLGGVDYFMFALHQEFQPKVKSSTIYEVYVENTAAARTNAKACAISTENTVVVGAEGVPEREYGVLGRLPFAPTIEWYNETLGKWVAVTVAKFDGKRHSDAPCADIEITFNLPTINTQF